MLAVVVVIMKGEKEEEQKVLRSKVVQRNPRCLEGHKIADFREVAKGVRGDNKRELVALQ